MEISEYKGVLGGVWKWKPVINPGVDVVEEDEVQRPVFEGEGVKVKDIELSWEAVGGLQVVVLERVFFCEFEPNCKILVT